MKKSAIILPVVLLGLSACSPLKGSKAQWSHRAPTSAAETGVLVQADRASIQALLDREGVSARVISEKQNLYEVFDISLEVVKKELPTAMAEKNVYFENLAPRQTRRFALDAQPSDDSAQPSDDSEDSGSPVDLDPFAGCTRDEESPNPMVTPLALEEELKKGLVEFGQELRFSSEGTAPHEKHPGELELTWIISAPGSSLSPLQLSYDKELKFVPDTVGEYGVILLAKDSRNVCAAMGLSMIVTDNPEYKKPTSSRQFGPNELAHFKHLAQVEAAAAQKLSTGQGVTIAILDTGVDYNHPDLAANILMNTKEIPGNGIDDDDNGFVDDVLGWDFASDDNSPFDDHGHGTHVAGLSAAETFGVATQAKILAVKAMNGAGGGDVGSIAGSIIYAADRGADIINASLGSSDAEFLTLQKAVDYAEEKGVLFVAAAGNGDPIYGRSMNLERIPVYPASFENESIVTVASVTGETLTSYSNFGSVSVDVAAPGGSEGALILSAAVRNPHNIAYTEMAGTSMAAPIVAGIAALVKSRNPSATPAEIKAALVAGGTESANLKGRVLSGRVISALGSVLAIESSPTPAAQIMTMDMAGL